MDDHLDEDRRLGELLSRELPIPEHREGYGEDVAALITAEAVAGADAKRRAPKVLAATWRSTRRRAEEQVDGRRRVSSSVRPRPGGLRVAAIALVVVVIVAGLGVGTYETLTHLVKDEAVLVITDEPMPATAMSEAEIGEWKAYAADFGDRYYAAWPDAEAVIAITEAEYADDAVYYDPSNGTFGIQGKQNLASACRQFFAANPDLSPEVTGMYLSAETAAYRLSTDGVLEVYPFSDGMVTRVDHWWSLVGLQAFNGGLGCFAPGLDGPEQLQEIADRYLTAWASGDEDGIAALYASDATFSDSLMGIYSREAGSIAGLGPARFGQNSKVTFEVIDLYAQTNGPDPPTEQLPEHGAIIGVGIHFRATVAGGEGSATFEGLTLFEIGVRMGQSFVLDPDGLIHREQIFYDVDSLMVSGLLR